MKAYYGLWLAEKREKEKIVFLGYRLLPRWCILIFPLPESPLVRSLDGSEEKGEGEGEFKATVSASRTKCYNMQVADYTEIFFKSP